MHEVIILITGVLAGFVSGFTGGGSGLLITPVLLIMGVPAYQAVATARMGSLGLSFGTIGRFFKSEAIQWRVIVPLIMVSIPAAFVGSYMVISIPEQFIEKIIGVILLLTIIFFWYKPRKKKKKPHDSNIVIYGVLFIVRVIEASLGTGINLLLNVAYVKLLHITATEANATKRIPGFILIVITLYVFNTEGLINFDKGILLFFGTIVGSFVGAHLALLVSQKYVNIAFSVVTVVLSLVLLMQ